MPVLRTIHAAKTMLPKLRIILAAMILTCAAVLALSAGLLGTRKDLAGVPEVSRTLVREAIIEEPEWQQFRVLAYSRRADELMRLRDLPVTPARAVVEYAEQAQAKAVETSGAPAAPAEPPVATPPAETAIATSPAPKVPATEPAPIVVAAAPTATPPLPAADNAAVATAPIDTPPAAVEPAPVATPPSDTAAATTIVTAHLSPPAVEVPVAPPADTAAVAPVPAVPGDTQVASVQPGNSETAEMYGPEKPKAAKRRHKSAQARTPEPKKKKIQVVRTTTTRTVGPTSRTVAPAASTGFPIAAPNNGWSNNNSRVTNDSINSRVTNDSITR